jgi:hypothetical protein
MLYNLNSGYGQAQASGIPFTTGKVFFVAEDGGANLQAIDDLYVPDAEGVARRFSTFTAALAACVADRGDVIVVSPNFEDALSAAELLAAETKGVRIVQANADKDGIVTVYAADTAIAGATDKSLFTVTGLVEVIEIVGKVGTVIETQANNTLLKINPTDGADVDLCAALNISAAAAKSFLSITGTAADALINTASGSFLQQASSIVVNAGVIELETAADNTGTVKWFLRYRPLEPGARVFAA